MTALLPALAALALAAAGSPPDADVPGPAAQPARSPPRQASLLGGASLGAGGVAWSAAAGYPRLAVAYAQGVGDRDDLGGLVDVDWVATEAVVAGGWRREIARSDAVHLALRLRLGLYACGGGTWLRSDNRPDVGLQLGGGLAVSIEAGPGLLTVAGDLPATWTFRRGGGWILAPLGTLAYETPVAGDLALGARLGAGVRGAGGGAPGADAQRTLVELLLVATWRIF